MKVAISIVYNGGFPRTHMVSEEFLARLEAFIAKRPWQDIVITRMA